MEAELLWHVDLGGNNSFHTGKKENCRFLKKAQPVDVHHAKIKLQEQSNLKEVELTRELVGGAKTV